MLSLPGLVLSFWSRVIVYARMGEIVVARYEKQTFSTIYLLCALALILFASTAVAEGGEGQVRVAATKSGSYDLENQVFVAQGDVEITSGDLVLLGDELHLDVSTGEVRLQGNVSLQQDDQELRGELLVYNLQTGTGTLKQARAEIVLAQETGSIFLSGQSIDLEEEVYTVSKARFTTCDLPESHYHLVTKELEFYPDEKVVIRGVTYYEGKIPLLYWPYLVIPLNWSDEDSVFTMPVFGYSEEEGYFMKNTFNYYFSSKSKGNVFLDLFTRLGVGVGARHFYDLGSWGHGSLYLYGIPTSVDPVVKSAFTHQWTKGSWNFKTTTNQENSWLKQELSSQNRLTFTVPKLNAEAWLNYKSNPAAKTKQEGNLGLKWSQSLTDRWRLNLQGTLTDRQTTERVRLVDYLAETIYRQGKHTLTLAAQQQYNPDLLEKGDQPWRSVQRVPELKWDVSDLGLSWLPLRSQVILGHYGERPSLITMNRAFGQLTLSQQAWRPTKSITVNYQGSLAAAAYGDGQRQTWTNMRLSLTQKLTGTLQFSSTYNRRDVWGATPFRFDRQKPQQDLSLRLSHTEPKWNATLNTSYNFLSKQFGWLTLQANARPNDAWKMSVVASYNLNTKTLDRVVPMVEYRAEKVDLRLGVRYRPAEKVLERVDARVSLPVGSTWHVSYDSIFEPPKQAFTRGTITVAKDLHCRELSVSYDHVAGRVALQYTIKAFPSLPIGWDSQGGLSLFELEEVTDIIGMKE